MQKVVCCGCLTLAHQIQAAGEHSANILEEVRCLPHLHKFLTPPPHSSRKPPPTEKPSQALARTTSTRIMFNFFGKLRYVLSQKCHEENGGKVQAAIPSSLCPYLLRNNAFFRRIHCVETFWSVLGQAVKRASLRTRAKRLDVRSTKNVAGISFVSVGKNVDFIVVAV